MLAIWLFAAWLSPIDLGSERFELREAAEDRARAVGPLAWPFLWPLASSESPEVRQRVVALLKRPAALLRDAVFVKEWLDTAVVGYPSEAEQKRLRLDPLYTAKLANAFRRLRLLTADERDTMERDWTRLDEALVTDTATGVWAARLRWSEMQGSSK